MYETCAPRSGIESTNSGLKNRLDLGRLRLRGRDVFRVLRHKVAGWNVLEQHTWRSCGWVQAEVARTLEGDELDQVGGSPFFGGGSVPAVPGVRRRFPPFSGLTPLQEK